MSRVPLALAPEVEKQLNREIEEAWHLMHISRGLTAGFWTEVQRAIEREYRLRGLLRIRRSARQAGKAVVVAGLLLAAAIATPTVRAEPSPWTPEDVRHALSRTSPTVACMVSRELGPALDPYAVGAAGEIGPAQLCPCGLLNDFQYGSWVDLAPEFRDPNSPYMATAYLESALDRGMGSNWSTFAGCVS